MADNARELFEHELRDIYDVENKLINALESMAKKVTEPALQTAFAEHREVTQNQAKRLEEIFGLLDRAPRREPCQGINGLIQEFQEFVKEESPAPEVLNLFATGAAQKVEAYEICSYKSLINLAENLQMSEAIALLQQNLAEEEQTAVQLEEMSKKLGPTLPVS